MKRMALPLLGALGLATAGCSAESNDRLLGAGSSWYDESLAAGENTQHHFQDPNSGDNGFTDPQNVKSETTNIGSAEVVARLHSCSKISYASLGAILASRGVDLGNKTAGSTGALYATGAQSLGVANYGGRVPEAVIASTAALSKQFDIFLAAGQELQQQKTLTMPGCPNVQLIDGSGQFTGDGISCLMGKPASANHVLLANAAVSDAQSKGLTMAEGQQLAIASILEAAHTCE